MQHRNRGSAQPKRQYDVERTRPSIAVVEALAEMKKVEPRALDFTLHDYVDTEALDSVVSDGQDITVSFTLDGYRVQVKRDAVVVERDERT